MKVPDLSRVSPKSAIKRVHIHVYLLCSRNLGSVGSGTRKIGIHHLGRLCVVWTLPIHKFTQITPLICLSFFSERETFTIRCAQIPWTSRTGLRGFKATWSTVHQLSFSRNGTNLLMNGKHIGITRWCIGWLCHLGWLSSDAFHRHLIILITVTIASYLLSSVLISLECFATKCWLRINFIRTSKVEADKCFSGRCGQS